MLSLRGEREFFCGAAIEVDSRGVLLRARSCSSTSLVLRAVLCALVALVLLPDSARAQSTTSAFNLDTSYPNLNVSAIAVNTETNKIYIATQSTSGAANAGRIFVLDGATNATITSFSDTSMDADQPYAIAINPVTNIIYVANTGGGSTFGSVTIVDGATDTYVATMSDGNSNGPRAIVVNPLTNTVYAANYISGNVTVYSGSTRNPMNGMVTAGTSLGTIGVGTGPVSLALNAAANLLYVVNSGVSGGVQVNNGSVTVVNIANSNSTTTVTDGSGAKYPVAVAVDDSLGGLVYVANTTPPSLTVISGSSYSSNIKDTNAASQPQSVAVNPLTHRVYVADYAGGAAGTVSIFQGTTYQATVQMSTGPNVVAVDTDTDIAYAPNNNGNISVISGATGMQIANLQSGDGLAVVSVNPVTHRAYIAIDNVGDEASLVVVDGATNATTSMSVEDQPRAIVVNPVTNMIYVANFDDDDVSVINGSTNTVVADPSVGLGPDALAVDPVNNLIYVGNFDSNSVSVIDGATNEVDTVSFSTTPISVDSLAYNPVLNEVYGASSADNLSFSFTSQFANQTVGDGGFVFGGANPVATATNPASGMQFNLLTTGTYDPYLTVQDMTAPQGFYDDVCSISAPPISMDVNSTTNTVFITCSDGTVNIVQGVDVFGTVNSSVIASAAGYVGPYSAIAVNPITNLAYVADYGSANLFVINGANNSFLANPISVGANPTSIAINIATNKIYVLSGVSGGNPSITVVDGVTNAVLATITIGTANQGTTFKNQIAANPVTGNIYGLTYGADRATAITENTAATPCLPTSCLQTTIDTFDNNTVYTSTPTFSFTATNSASSAPVTGVYFQVDTWQGTWNPTTLSSGTYSGTLPSNAPPIPPGFHMLYAYATAGDDANTSSTSGLQASPLVGAIAAYGFLVAPPIADTQQNLFFGSVAVGTSGGSQTAYLANNGAATMTYSYTITGAYPNDFIPDSSATQTCGASGTVSAVSYCGLHINFQPSTVGPETATLIWTDNSLATATNATQTITLSGTGANVAAPTILTGPSNPTSQTSATFTFNDSDSGVTSFTCQLDSQPPASCVSGVTYNSLAATSHTFAVYGTASGINSPTSNYPWTITPASSYTVSVAELGTGTGTVSDGGNLSCSEASGIQSGNCSNSYPSPGPSVTLTATTTAPSTFIGWGGGACTAANSSVTPSGGTCGLNLNSNVNVTANFLPAPTTITVTFPVSLIPVTETATYNCPGNANPTPANPCTAAEGPSATSVSLTAQAVSTSFQVSITSTEVPPTIADGICESNIDTPAGVAADFDCRFLQFFNYGTDPTTSGAIVPLCVPYSNGNCVHYEVSSPGGGEPTSTNYLGPINWVLTWNDDSVTAPGPYWTGSTPQLYDDPDYAVFPTSPFGTDCTVAMTVNSGPAPTFACQFEFDITTFYNPTEPVDSGIGGTTRQFNDVVVAWPPTSVPNNTTLPLLNGNSTTTPANGSATFGNSVGFNITLTNNGTTTASGITLNDPLPPGATWTLSSSSVNGCSIAANMNPQTLTCPSFSLAPATTATFSVSSSNAGAGVYANTATFTIGTQQTLAVATVTVQGLTPSFSGLSSKTISYGTASLLLSGTVGVGGVYPAAGDTVQITINGNTQSATIAGTSGGFSYSFPTATIPASATPYTVTYKFLGDSSFASVTNTSTTLTVTKATSTTTITSNNPNPSTAGQSVTVAFKVTGTGTPTGSVTVTAKLSATTVTCSASLSSGAGSCGVVLSTAGGWTLTASYAGDGNFNTSSTASGTAQTVNAAASALKFTPATLNFGTVYVGNTELLTTTITNTGSSMVTFTSFSIASISGDDSTGYLGIAFCPKTLNAGKTCTIIMSFTADSNVTKTHAANLVIADNASGSPQSIPMSATVINPKVTLSATSLSFGTQKTGTTSSSKLVTLTNSGTTNLSLTGLTITGNFGLASGTTCTNSTTLLPGKPCSIYINFAPQSPKGSKTGKVTITDNAQNSPQSISLTGTGN